MLLMIGKNPQTSRYQWPWAVFCPGKARVDTGDPAMAQMDRWCWDRLGRESEDWRSHHRGWLFAEHEHALEFYLTWG